METWDDKEKVLPLLPLLFKKFTPLKAFEFSQAVTVTTSDPAIKEYLTSSEFQRLRDENPEALLFPPDAMKARDEFLLEV